MNTYRLTTDANCSQTLAVKKRRLRISKFQVRIMRMILNSDGGCSPFSNNSKEKLFGITRDRRNEDDRFEYRPMTGTERVTLSRSVSRLIANGMVVDNGYGWCCLTERGRQWLADEFGSESTEGDS